MRRGLGGSEWGRRRVGARIDDQKGVILQTVVEGLRIPEKIDTPYCKNIKPYGVYKKVVSAIYLYNSSPKKQEFTILQASSYSASPPPNSSNLLNSSSLISSTPPRPVS